MSDGVDPRHRARLKNQMAIILGSASCCWPTLRTTSGGRMLQIQKAGQTAIELLRPPATRSGSALMGSGHEN